MTISMYQASAPRITNALNNLSFVLEKAQAFVDAKKLDESALTRFRLYPDMLNMTRQVQIACDFAKSVPSRIAGVDVAAYEDTEQSFAELQQRIAKTVALIDTFTAAKFEGSTVKEVVLRPGTPKEKTLSVEDYALKYGMPQFFFHVATTYNLLRSNGVEIGKKDFMGTY